MRVGLADEEEVAVVEERAPAEGLMGVEIVAQEGEGARVIAGGIGLQQRLAAASSQSCLVWPSCGVMNSGRRAMTSDWPGATSTGVTAL